MSNVYYKELEESLTKDIIEWHDRGLTLSQISEQLLYDLPYVRKLFNERINNHVEYYIKEIFQLM